VGRHGKPRPTAPGLVRRSAGGLRGNQRGFIGLSAAPHLAKVGQDVVLLEAETLGWGASGRNGGQVNPGPKDGPAAFAARFGADLGGWMTQLAGAGGDLVFGLIEKHKIRCDARRVGWISAAHTCKALANLHAVAEWRATGAAVDDLDAAEIQRLLGTPGYVGDIVDRRGGNLHPLNYALGLADAAERAGARLHGDSRVTGLGSDGDLVAVTTAEGRVTARRVLICTNAYTGGLADPLGKTVVPETSVQVATAPLSSNVAASIPPDGHAPSDTRRLLIYFRKDAQRRFIIGGRGALADRDVLARQQSLRDVALGLYPHLAGATWTHA
jgi:glycine/D-amino acid oxidase-like deaminating enzyme